MTTYIDMGGNTPIVEGIRVGATGPGQLGTELAGSELSALDGATSANTGTGKALITGTSGAVTLAGAVTHSTTSAFTGVATFNADPVIGAGKTLNLDSAPLTFTSNAVTATKYAGQYTTEALTTAAGASQALVITFTGLAATDLAFVSKAGGTNTRKNYQLEAVMTTNTCTVTLYNSEPTNAINGTVIFNLWIVKA